MNANRLSDWLQIVGNVGIVAGLVLVALQLKQGADIAQAQLMNDYYLADMQLELAMMGEDPADPWIKAVYTPDQLSRQDAAILDRYFNFGLVQVDRMQRMQELGMADDDWTISRFGYLNWHLGNEVGRRWWSHSKQFWPDEFVRMVDAALAAPDAHPSNRRLLDALQPHDERDVTQPGS